MILFRRKHPPPVPPMPDDCAHPCVSCHYFNQVRGLTASDFLRRDVAELKDSHVRACNAGEPQSSSCKETG